MHASLCSQAVGIWSVFGIVALMFIAPCLPGQAMACCLSTDCAPLHAFHCCMYHPAEPIRMILMGSAAQSPYLWFIRQVVCVSFGAHLHMMALTMADSTHRYYSTSLLMSMPLHRVQTGASTNFGASPDPEEDNYVSSHKLS
ncbi:hypothetical protein CVIRNUC_000086 [Coccomyxa viridis]|uniref:Secreted protein n=1 Tax=Coccomyxa viridis TaxID=1274662 RepID=A0AAV1HS10_9CHLO|nr:hypothetical protein CVIRNUC_000086 [Coccomyxa viridis]